MGIPLSDQEKTILEMRNTGKTFDEISADLGINRSRAGEIAKTAEYKLNPPNTSKWRMMCSAGEMMSARLVHCLLNLDLKTIDDVVAKNKEPDWNWMTVNNFGRTCLTELRGILERHERRKIQGR